MYSAETAVMLLNQLAQKKPHNDIAPHRQQFVYYSAIRNQYQAMVDVYNADATVPMRTYSVGISKISDRSYPDFAIEIRQNSYTGWLSNTNGSGVGSNGVDPLNGFTGISLFAQTGTLVNVDFNEENMWSFQWQTWAYLFASCGVIVGEPGYRQGINLLKYNGNLAVGTLFSRMPVLSNPANITPWTDITGIRRLFPNTSAGLGDVGYSRVTNTLAFIERGVTFQYRLHIFKGLPKLRADAYHLKAALNAASANAATYETVDFVWSGVDNTEWHDGTRIILCDDGSIWLSRMYPSSGLYLATVSAPVNGVRAFSTVGNLSTTTSYGREQGNPYGIRHMNSDDGSVVAVYCPYYYYLGGLCAYFLSRASVNGMRAEYVWGSTGSGASIAPCGGPNFAMDHNGNNDGQFVRGWQTTLSGALAADYKGTIGMGTSCFNIAGLGGSTSVGSNGVIKVQPVVVNTTEYKERNL